MEEDQEKYVDDAMKIIKAQAFHLHKTIEDNQLRQCLKETSIMLGELKTSLLTPRYYYQIYTTIFDEMQYLEQYFKEEYRRGRKLKYLYDSVQQASSIIPRLYLLITVGSVYIESQTVAAGEIIFDLLQMVKGVQNPLRGLFCRYYLLKMIKDKLPDKDNEYEQGGSKFEDTLKFILQNLEEMNRLWIRLSIGCTGNERLIREKERNELKILVGENIVRLASLNGLTLEMYKDEVLPKIINILLESKDQLSQQYLMECIIHAFPDDYNIHCMGTILDTCTNLVPTVDIKQLFINLMDKLAKFVGDSGRDQTEMIESAEKIFDLLQQNIDKIIEENSGVDTLKLVELLTAFIKFALKCSPNKLAVVNHSLSSSVNILSKSKSDTKHSQESIKLIGRLLSAPLESTLSIFEMPSFPVLMTYLDYASRSTLALRIIEQLITTEKNQQETVLNSSERINILLDFIKPLLVDSSDTIESDIYQFEYEQQAVTKLIFIIFNNNPDKLFEMYNILLGVFLKGGARRIKFTLPSMVNAFIAFCAMVTYGYENKLSGSLNGKPIHDDFVNKLEINFDNSTEYIKLLTKAYSTINEVIVNIAATYPELGFKLYLSVLTQVNDIKVERSSFEQTCYNFAASASELYKDGKIEPDRKMPLLLLYIGTVAGIDILNSEDMGRLVANLEDASKSLVKRSDQCIVMLNFSHLYEKSSEVKRIEECLTKAKRFADFAMTNAQNLNLFVLILNKYLYYIEKGVTSLKIDNINDIIEIVKNHIITIETENKDNATFLPEIKKYFETTIEVIKNRKKTCSALEEVQI
jgi:vacuolar protein sorting-associated protein 35